MYKSNTNTKKKGGVAKVDYPFTVSDNVPQTDISSTTKSSTPGLNGGNRRNSKGGCGCASNSLRKGGNIALPSGVELAPFISALALLGARMLADKNPTLNMTNILGKTSKPKSLTKSPSLTKSKSASVRNSRKYND